MVMKIDTGACVTVVPYNSKIPNIRPARIILKGPNNMNIKARGCVDAIITYKGKSIKEEIYIL